MAIVPCALTTFGAATLAAAAKAAPLKNLRRELLFSIGVFALDIASSRKLGIAPIC